MNEKIYNIRRYLGLSLEYLKSKYITHIPFFLAHSITYGCNSKCKTCTMWMMARFKKRDWPLWKVKILIDEAYDIGMRGYYAFGGEPTVRDDLPDILRYAKSKGFVTTVNTNGSRLGLMADELSKYLDVAFVSLDYPGLYHDYIRGRRGNFKEVIEGIVKLLERKKTKIFLVSTISKLNLKHMEDIALFAKSAGLGVSFNAVEPTLTEYNKIRTYWPVYKYGLSKHELKYFYKKLLELKLRGYPLMESRIVLEDYAYGRPFKCHFSKIFVYVTPDGKIFPCTYNYGLGIVDLEKISFYDYFKSEGFKKHVKLSENCKVCLRTCVRMYAYTYEFRLAHIIQMITSSRDRLKVESYNIDFLRRVLEDVSKKEEPRDLSKIEIKPYHILSSDEERITLSS